MAGAAAPAYKISFSTFRATCAFRAKIRVFLGCSKSVSAYVERSKNFLEFWLFAAGRLRIWLIFGGYSGRRRGRGHGGGLKIKMQRAKLQRKMEELKGHSATLRANYPAWQ
jgi:hypothetical protein